MKRRHGEADHPALGISPEPRALHAKVIKQLDDVGGVTLHGMCFATSGPIALTMAAVIEHDALVRRRERLDVTGIAPHRAVARPACLKD
jgi:hypothetical protein